MLFQDDCGGLEVEDINNPGQFIPATPFENAIVINVGDFCRDGATVCIRRPVLILVC